MCGHGTGHVTSCGEEERVQEWSREGCKRVQEGGEGGEWSKEWSTEWSTEWLGGTRRGTASEPTVGDGA